MSHFLPETISSRFQAIFNHHDALEEHKKWTKNDLTAHPFVPRLEVCDSPTAVLDVLHDQLCQLNQSWRVTRGWLKPTVKRLLHIIRNSWRWC
jgi:hypothetical protein